jgi:hypothetical protein
MKIIDQRNLTPKTYARTVNIDSFATDAINLAIKNQKPTVEVTHGGTVANSYKYKAFTDAVVAVAWPDGRCLVSAKRIPANKATLSGVLAATFGEWARPYRDYRFDRTDLAKQMIVEYAEKLL